MIKVIIKKNKQQIEEIKITGHANSAEYGKDLVCAGVSTASVGIANALVKKDFLKHGTIDIREGFVHIKVNQSERDIQVVLETFEVILELLRNLILNTLKSRKWRYKP